MLSVAFAEKNRRFLESNKDDYGVYAVSDTTLSPEDVDTVGGLLGRCISAPLRPGRRTWAFREVVDRESFMLDFSDHNAVIALSLEDAKTK